MTFLFGFLCTAGGDDTETAFCATGGDGGRVLFTFCATGVGDGDRRVLFTFCAASAGDGGREVLLCATGVVLLCATDLGDERRAGLLRRRFSV